MSVKCLFECFQKGWAEEGRPNLNGGVIIPWAGNPSPREKNTMNSGPPLFLCPDCRLNMTSPQCSHHCAFPSMMDFIPSTPRSKQTLSCFPQVFVKQQENKLCYRCNNHQPTPYMHMNMRAHMLIYSKIKKRARETATQCWWNHFGKFWKLQEMEPC